MDEQRKPKAETKKIEALKKEMEDKIIKLERGKSEGISLSQIIRQEEKIKKNKKIGREIVISC